MANRKITAVAAVAVLMVAGCSSPPALEPRETAGNTATPIAAATTAAPLAAHGVEVPIEMVPWSQVGPGWTLATWSPVTTLPGDTPPPDEPAYETATTTLYLVNPAGGRYPITTLPAPGDKANPELVDWSGDGKQALMYAAYAEPSTAILVDLHTGAQTTVPVQGTPRFTEPTGKALLLTTEFNGKEPPTLERVDLAGKRQLLYPTDQLGSPFNGQYLSTPDGTRLVLGTAKDLVLMGNDGKVGATVPISGQYRCSPIRWWDDGGTVLATCDVGDTGVTRLWLVPIDGRAPTALTAPNDHRNGPSYGDLNAWHLPAGTFVQTAGACGVVFLEKLNADGSTSPVSVPETDADASIHVIGINGGDLTLKASSSCGPGESLIDYNPTTDTSTVLLGPPVNGGGVVKVLAYPGQE